MMVKAGFTTVFVGIETPDTDSLEECGKLQNKNRDLVESVKLIQNMGLEVQGGFIVGFDSDKASIFQRQIEFIQKSGIVTAMVGLLTALPRTRLYKRLQDTGRIIENTSGDHTKASVLNFTPKMDKTLLLDGYQKVLSTIYAPKQYYARIKTLLMEFKPRKVKSTKLRFYHIRALVTSMWILGVVKRGRFYYWKLITWSLFRKPRLFPHAVGYTLVGIHFRSLAFIH